MGWRKRVCVVIMAESLTVLNLSQAQKEVLAMIIAAPEIPGKEGKKLDIINQKMLVAREVLTQLGIITFNVDGDEHVDITDKGREIAQEENLTDENNQLTSVGLQLATAIGEPRNEPAPQGGIGGGPEMPGMTNKNTDIVGAQDPGSMPPGPYMRNESFKEFLQRVGI